MNSKVKKSTKSTKKENEKRIEEEVRKRIEKEVAKRDEESWKEEEELDERIHKQYDALEKEPLFMSLRFLGDVLSASGVEILQSEHDDGFHYPLYLRCSWDIAKRIDNISYYYTRKVGDNIWQIGLKSEESDLDSPDLAPGKSLCDYDDIREMADSWMKVHSVSWR